MKPNDKAYQAAIAEGKLWAEGFKGSKNQIPYWQVLRQATDKRYGYDVIAKFTNREERDEALERLRAEAMVNAAYAAQFQSEDYAGLIERLRSQDELYVERYIGTQEIDEDKIEPLCNEAADAIEAVLAERDALKAENDQHKSVYQKYVEAIDRMNGTPCEQVRHHYEVSELRSELALAVSERDALAARLAPVDDEALVEIAARGICLERAAPACRCKDDSICKAPVENLRDHNAVWLQARAAIAAIRPHIEAVERERCAKIAEEGEDGSCWTASERSIAAAIRSGK